MSEKKRIALVEIGGSHDECLYSQVRFLKEEGHFVSLICTKKLESNVAFFEGLDEIHSVELRGRLRQWIDLWKIRKLLVKGKFDAIVFNTAQGNVLKNLLLLRRPGRSKLFGILHNVQKLSKSHNQRVITRNLDGYFVLNDYLIDVLPKELQKSVNIHSTYTMFYPNYPEAKVDKPESEIWICIPGQVERSRRDYDGLFDSIEEHGIGESIKFLFLGRCEHSDGDGEYVKERISQLKLEKHFILWDAFIETDFFYTVIRKSDYILPLIHPEHASFDLYTHQISGSFNLAFGYKKPLLLNSCFSNFEDFKSNAIFYSQSEMMKNINTLTHPNSGGFYQEEKWNFEIQKRNYLSVIDSKK